MLDNIGIGNQILLLRKRNGFTQEELAEKLEISAQAISKWENGHTLPETALLPLLAKLLNTSIDSILMPVIIKEGAIIPFGKHQWRVLKTDGNSALIITESVIEQRAYHEEFTEITWEHCDLRKYLNRQFYDTFDPTDRARILETRITDLSFCLCSLGHSKRWLDDALGRQLNGRVLCSALDGSSTRCVFEVDIPDDIMEKQA